MDSQEIKKNKVSFSQYATYLKCPYKWKLDYLDNLRVKDDNIHTTFGTAIHHVFQHYLTTLYKESLVAAESLDLKKIFFEKFTEEAKKIKSCDENEFMDFVYDGHDIIESFVETSTRIKHFPTSYELVGVEIPLELPIKNNVDFVGFIDLVLKEKDEDYYKIIDFKTSSTGWNKYQKEDESKYAQLHLYKSVYSQKFGVPLNNIQVEFFIVKRKLYQTTSYPQSRIQIFKPPSGSHILKESINGFVEFLDHGFNPDGSYNNNKTYVKIPGPKNKNCKYCTHFKTRCDGKTTT